MRNIPGQLRSALRVVCCSTILSIAAGASPALAGTTRPPLGLQLYCLQHQQACRSSAEAVLPLSNGLMQTIKRVNRHVNSSIAPRSDGGADVWQVGGGFGDCEDYVMTKRARLIEQGVSRGALRIAYTRTRSGEGHALLIIKTDRGELALDNLVDEVKLLSSTGYRVTAMSSSDMLNWKAQ